MPGFVYTDSGVVRYGGKAVSYDLANVEATPSERVKAVASEPRTINVASEDRTVTA